MKTTTISDLKQNLSARLQTVQAGESFMVTDRRSPIAVLAPLPATTGDARLRGLVGGGVLTPPRQALNVDRFRALPRGTWKAGLTAAIREERDGR